MKNEAFDYFCLTLLILLSPYQDKPDPSVSDMDLLFPVLLLLFCCDLTLCFSWRGHRPRVRVTSISPTQSLSLRPGEVRDLELECGIEGDLGPELEAVWTRLGGTAASILGAEEELLAVWGEEGEGGTSVYKEGVEATMVREGEGAHTWSMVIMRVSIAHSGLYQCQVDK